MQLLKWLSVTDRFYKIYLDKQLAPYGMSIYVLNQNLSFARHFTGFFNGYVLCSSEQYCTDSCGIRKAGNDYAFPK